MSGFRGQSRHVLQRICLTLIQLDFSAIHSMIPVVAARVGCWVMPEVGVLTLSQRCQALAEECRSKAQSFRNIKPRTQMLQLASDYERKAHLAEALETSLRKPYDHHGPLPEIFEAFLTPSKSN